MTPSSSSCSGTACKLHVVGAEVDCSSIDHHQIGLAGLNLCRHDTVEDKLVGVVDNGQLVEAHLAVVELIL